VNIGDELEFTGRHVGAPATCAVIEVAYNVYEQYRTVVRGTNVVGTMDPSRFQRMAS
jgi:hypothetical protein